MDKTIRKNSYCVVGMPQCDFVFSSTRTCFIAYGFDTSPLEVSVLRKILNDRGIQCEEAGGQLAPGQMVFCQKICSKIITAQFCIILLNHDDIDGRLTPNANVNMEYGLMLGFNKYLIPFQKEDEKLPFNVAGIDTVKYNNTSFEREAKKTIDIAIELTSQSREAPAINEQSLQLFFLSKKLIPAEIDSSGTQNIANFGKPFGFRLLHDFSGMNYSFLGLFTTMIPELVVWRLTKLNELLQDRNNSLNERVKIGMFDEQMANIIRTHLIQRLNVIVLITSDTDKNIITEKLSKTNLIFKYELYTFKDILNELEELEKELTK